MFFYYEIKLLDFNMYIVVSVSYTFSILSYLRIRVRVVSVSVSVFGHHSLLPLLPCHFFPSQMQLLPPLREALQHSRRHHYRKQSNVVATTNTFFLSQHEGFFVFMDLVFSNDVSCLHHLHLLDVIKSIVN